MTTSTTWSPSDLPAPPDDPSDRPPIDAIGHLVVVPRTIGPLVDVDARSAGKADELDAAIDELFGETTEESAGPLDAALVLGGIGVIGWSLLVGAPAPVALLGCATALLGLALPARAITTASRERRRASARTDAVGDGLAIDASDPTVLALAEAYGACLAAAARPGIRHADDARDAAHLALMEVASLLNGGRPVADAEVEYVRKRTQAIGKLTLRLQRAQRQQVEARLDAAIHRTPAGQGWATALTEARVELESTTGLSSLDRLDAVGTTIEQEGPDAQR